MNIVKTLLALVVIAATVAFVWSIKDVLDRADTSGRTYETNQVIEGNW